MSRKYKHPTILVRLSLLAAFFLLIFMSSTHAALGFTAQQVERVRETRPLLADVDRRPAERIIREFEQTAFPEGHLRILEAIAFVYSEIVRDYKIDTQLKKENLRDRILLNLAYLQLGGLDRDRTGSGLDRLIQRKLLERLPEELLTDPRLSRPLE